MKSQIEVILAPLWYLFCLGFFNSVSIVEVVLVLLLLHMLLNICLVLIADTQL